MRNGLGRELRRREEERGKVLALARKLTEVLRSKLGRVTVVLYGSYARGDFNLWSDVDIVIISDKFLEVPPLKRYDMIMDLLPPKFEAKLWTPDEARKLLSKPWWREALKRRVVLADDYNLLPASLGLR